MSGPGIGVRPDALHCRAAARVAWSAWGMCTATVALVGAAFVLWTVASPPPAGVEQFSANAWGFALAMVGFAVLAALVTVHVPDNPLGHLLGWFALLTVVSPAAYQYALAGLPGWEVAAWVNAWLWIVPIAVLAEVVLRFPHGRVPSSGLRWIQRTARAGAALAVVVGVALWPRRGLALLTVGDAFPGVAGLVAAVALPLVFGSFLAAAAALVVRLRGARDDERQQLKWLVYAVVVIAVALLVFAVGDLLWGGAQPLLGDVLSTVGILGVPAAMWIAITRHRLYEIDRLISRTLAYAAVTTLLVGVYVLIAVVPSVLFDVRSDLLVAVATLAAAGLFRPLRRRVQGAVDRRFNRTRYDAARTIDAFAARLRRDLGPSTLADDVAGVVAATMQPVAVSVWLRDPAGVRGTTRDRSFDLDSPSPGPRGVVASTAQPAHVWLWVRAEGAVR